MNSIEVLVDAFGRVRSDVHRAVAGLDEKTLNLRLDAEANPVGWLVWHLTRVQDDHLAELAGTEQAYNRRRTGPTASASTSIRPRWATGTPRSRWPRCT